MSKEPINDIEPLGIAMEGLEQTVMECIQSTMEPNYVYVELGIAEGRTLYSVARYISQFQDDFKCIGVDIKNGWSLDVDKLALESTTIPEDRVKIDLSGSQSFLVSLLNDSVNFLWIDACHGKNCVIADFLLAEHKIKTGGIIGFHDSDPESQGKDIQPHCGNPIQVREAIEYLGFFQGRPGWVLERDVRLPPDSLGRGCIIVRKL